MKKIKSILCIFLMAIALMFTSCNSCTKPAPGPEPVVAGYNYDSTVCADYDYIASQYPVFYFYEADVVFDTTIDDMNAYVESIQTVFQIEDTCIIFRHNPDFTTDTLIVQDHWMECMPMDARNAVNFDSCMAIIAPYRLGLVTKYMTFRRVLAPPFPENGQYIFGPGFLVVDAKTGEIVDWDATNSNDTIKSIKDRMLEASRLETDTNYKVWR